MKAKTLFFFGIMALVMGSFTLTSCSDDDEKPAFDTELLVGWWDATHAKMTAYGETVEFIINEESEQFVRLNFLPDGTYNVFGRDEDDGSIVLESIGTWTAKGSNLIIREREIDDDEWETGTAVVRQLDNTTLRLFVDDIEMDEDESGHPVKGSLELTLTRNTEIN